MILEDLIAAHGAKGKWFAAAKTARFLDIALDCAVHHDAAPATLIRAARNLKLKEPDFAALVALCAVQHLVQGRGYEPSPLDLDQAVEHLMVAARRIGGWTWRCRSCAASQVQPDQRASWRIGWRVCFPRSTNREISNEVLVLCSR